MNKEDLTQEQYDKICELIDFGRSDQVITRELNIPSKIIRQIRVAYHAKDTYSLSDLQRENKIRTQMRNLEICERYLAGEQIASLAKEFEIAASTLRQILKKSGVGLRRKKICKEEA